MTVANSKGMAIICGTDFGNESKAATAVATALAGKLGERLVLVHAVDLPPVTFMAGDAVVSPPVVPDPVAARREALEAMGTLAEELGRKGVTVIPEAEIGRGEDILLRQAARHQTDLIVVGTHGRRAPERWLLGSTAERLTRTSHWPLLILRGEGRGFLEWSKERPLRLLVGLDFEEVSEQAGRLAARLAAAGPCLVSFAYVAQAPGRGSSFGAGAAREAARQGDLEASARVELAGRAGRLGAPTSPDRMHILWGKPAEALARLAEEEKIDLVLVGTHGRRGLERALLGSVAQGVLRRAPCAVCVVPAR